MCFTVIQKENNCSALNWLQVSFCYMQHYAVIHKYVGVHCCIDGVERYGQVKLFSAEVGTYRYSCVCGNVCGWVVGVLMNCTEQAAFFVVSVGDSSYGKNFIQSAFSANRRRQYWKLVIYKYLISWSTFISGNFAYFSLEFWICVFESCIHTFWT